MEGIAGSIPAGSVSASGDYGDFLSYNASIMTATDPDLGRLDVFPFEIQTDNRVGVVVLRFADQRIDGRSMVGFGGRGVSGAPTGVAVIRPTQRI